MTDHQPILTTERLREIAEHLNHQIVGQSEASAMAAELLAKREECYAILAVIDEGSIEPFDIGPCVISGPIGLRDRGGMIEVRHEVMQGVFAQLAQRVSEQVPGTIESIRRLWLVETERDAFREACERKHQDGWAWLQLSQQREAERDAARAEAEKLRAEVIALRARPLPSTGLGELDVRWQALVAEGAKTRLELQAIRAEADSLRSDVTEAQANLEHCIGGPRESLAQAVLEVCAEAEKLRAYAPQPFDDSLPTYASVLRTLHETEAELAAVKRQRDELRAWCERWRWQLIVEKIDELAASQPAQQPKPAE